MKPADRQWTIADMDIVTPQRRSAIMSRIRGKDTKPEMRVRRFIHGLGLRYRLHRKDLPGRPDLVFPSRRLAVFVHGCFWHGHEGCGLAYKPKSNVEFWTNKLKKNQERDARAIRELSGLGWETKVIWECETSNEETLDSVLRKWFPDAFCRRQRGSSEED